jgi:hypothetical protein
MLDSQSLALSDGQFRWTDPTPALPLIDPADLTFVICVERNIIGAQALLLCRSLRRFGGRYKDCAVVAVSPRPALTPDPGLIHQLTAMGVRVVVLPLNRTNSSYGPINRIVASAWAERTLTTPYLAVLDSDMAFLAAPEFHQTDVGLRPVDTKGTASAGPDDPLDTYWAGVFQTAGVPLDRAPWLVSTACKTRIRASYNGGFCVARRSLGVFQATSAIFFAGFAAGTAPTPDPQVRVYASTGPTTAEASAWWGSSQAALSAAVSAKVAQILIYPDSYNIPLHIIARRPAMPGPTAPPVLIHYHHLTAEPYRPAFRVGLDRIGAPPAARDWIAAQCADLDWPLAG